MRFAINFKSGKPVYLQLADQVRTAAASGALRTGECLPSIRPLAEELRVNRNTVAKAYAELEAQGVIETHPGKGCFLRSAQSPLRKDARRKALAETLTQQIGKEMMITIPTALVVQRDEEQIGAFKILQSLLSRY